MDLGITQSMIKPIQGYSGNPNYSTNSVKKSNKIKTISTQSTTTKAPQTEEETTEIDEQFKRQSSDLISLIKVANEKLNIFVNNNESMKRPEPVVVEIYLIFLRIGEIDNVKERFQADAYFEASWEDNSVDVKAGFNSNVNWDPELFIENSVGNLKQDIKHRVEKRDDKTIVVEMRTIKGIFWERLELGDFPLDIQNLSVSITSARDKKEIIFAASKDNQSAINTKDFQQQQEWNLFTKIDTYHRDKQEKWRNLVRPVFTISATISRRPGYFLYNAYMLIFLISVLGFVPFCFSCKQPHFRIQTTCLLILSSLNFRYILSSKLPVICYLTTLDKYSIFAQFFLIVLCAWHAVIGCNYFRQKELNKTAFIDDNALITIASLYILYHLVYATYFLVKFFRNAKIAKELSLPSPTKKKEEEEENTAYKEESTPFIEPAIKKRDVKLEPPPFSPPVVKEKPKVKSKSQIGLTPSFTDINSDMFFNQKLKNIEIDPNRPTSFGYQMNSLSSRVDAKNSSETLNKNPSSNNMSGNGKNIQFQEQGDSKIVSNPFSQQASGSYRRTGPN